ncbi:hypothetical protein RvY_02001 [Ramazzottius varieornatus]|uniref:Uncharacterized protein n=1 Tax=Ramazzottius varieornatus TaxID=947166 RepID=A0A1D1UP79_RAMVA|nr:hypothetical protein RvY_02001 [Ramazzottius varieornatus]
MVRYRGSAYQNGSGFPQVLKALFAGVAAMAQLALRAAAPQLFSVPVTNTDRWRTETERINPTTILTDDGTTGDINFFLPASSNGLLDLANVTLELELAIKVKTKDGLWAFIGETLLFHSRANAQSILGHAGFRVDIPGRHNSQDHNESAKWRRALFSNGDFVQLSGKLACDLFE